MQVKRIAILFSGNGSNFEALVCALHQKIFIESKNVESKENLFLIGGITKDFIEISEKNAKEHKEAFKVEVVLALSNKAEAYGLERAKRLGILAEVIESGGKSREEFDKEIVELLRGKDLDLCVLAGFMRILTPVFTTQIKALNIHPSILPLFKGANGILDSYNAPMCVGGVSVHFVSEELDSGEIVAQGVIKKDFNESLESYAEKIHALEYYLYPKAVLQVLA